MHEVPKVIADEIEPEATPQDTSENIKHENSGSPRSILSGASKIPNHVIATNGTASAWTSHSTDYAGASFRLFISFLEGLLILCVCVSDHHISAMFMAAFVFFFFKLEVGGCYLTWIFRID